MYKAKDKKKMVRINKPREKWIKFVGISNFDGNKLFIFQLSRILLLCCLYEYENYKQNNEEYKIAQQNGK